MTRIVHCPQCSVELTIPEEAGEKRLRCPKCAARFHPADGVKANLPEARKAIVPEKSPEPRVPKPVKVPPSSGLHTFTPSGSRSAEIPLMADLSSLDDLPVLKGSSSAMTDAAALFRDEPATPRRKPAAEARREARKCPSCGGAVLGGMSLCERCGLDLDTGQRHVVEDYLDEVEEPEIPEDMGTPISVLVIGVTTLCASLTMGVLSVISFEGLGRLCLTMTCLFGVVASIQFLKGRTAQALIVALLLGGAVDVVTLIVLPIVSAELEVAPHGKAGQQAEDVETMPSSSEAEGDADLDPTIEAAPLVKAIDTSKIVGGVILLFVDAFFLVWISTPTVQGYFRPKRSTSDSGQISI